MSVARALMGIGLGATLAAGIAIAPALGATDQGGRAPRRAAVSSVRAGSFTPAAADPRLAAIFARGGFDATGFRFTPAETGRTRGVTVVVRARAARGADPVQVAANASALTPMAYNVGASVGWKRLAVTGDVSRVDLAQAPGGRESANVALSYTGDRLTGRVKAGADRPYTSPASALVRLPDEGPGYSLDASTSYSLTRNLDVTAGIRYRTDRERLAREDVRRDSQAVYVGTAFSF